MERLSHDLNLALDESSCGKHGRRKFGMRRRTRSAGNLPASLSGVNEDESSSSPPQAAMIPQAISDSDDPQLNNLCQGNAKNRVAQFCAGGNFESDSFNENFSPAKPPNARRKRKFKKMAIEYSDNCNDRSSPPLLIGPPSQVNLLPNCSMINVQGAPPFTLISKKKKIFKHNCQDGFRLNAFCGKRKWSHRERSELGEMRERSFSGGCTSKSYFSGKSSAKSFLDFKNSKKYLPIDKVPKFKDKHVVVKSVVLKNGLETALQNISLSSISTTPSIPGSSTFNFVYRPPSKMQEPPIIGKVLENNVFTLPFSTLEDQAKNQGVKSKKHEKSHRRKHKHPHKSNQLRNPLQFDDPNIDMELANSELVSSSSISSSDSEGVVTNDSDREGDDELTDWPGNEEISAFNKNLNLKNPRLAIICPNKPSIQVSQKCAPKKDKFIPKQGLNSIKNVQKSDNKETEYHLMDDDTMMSDSGSVLDTFAQESRCKLNQSVDSVDSTTLTNAFTSFADVKNAGLLNNNANEAFFHSFQSFQDMNINKENDQYTPRTNFTLQKTSSSDLNLSEKSPQSDHCYSEHSVCFGPPGIREIRAGCRRLRDERPGFAILSAANEQLARFLQDSCQDELKLPCIGNDIEEQEKLASLAKLYSLELSVELGRPILRKTSNTTQSIRVEHTRLHRQRFLSEFKRRCYGVEYPSEQFITSQSTADSNKKAILSVDPDASTSGTIFLSLALAKAPTLNDLSQSQDYDQGFSSLGNTPPLDVSDDLKSHCKSDGGFSSDGS